MESDKFVDRQADVIGSPPRRSILRLTRGVQETNVSAAAWNTLDWLKSVSTVAVPVYQRDYRWDQVTCERLLSDIGELGEAEDGSAHFIGSILTTPADNGDLTLVDGQQRVTTIMLIVAAVRDHAAGSEPAIAEAAADILLRPGDRQASRLRAHERYEDVVRGLMTGSGGFAGDSTMEANYLALVELMRPNWRAVWQGLRRVEHVLISLGERADAQQIFESLNSTGARLSDDELIHNYIHMGRAHGEQVELERRTWQPIELATRGATRQFWRDYLVWSSDKQPDLRGSSGSISPSAGAIPTRRSTSRPSSTPTGCSMLSGTDDSSIRIRSLTGTSANSSPSCRSSGRCRVH